MAVSGTSEEKIKLLKGLRVDSVQMEDFSDYIKFFFSNAVQPHPLD